VLRLARSTTDDTAADSIEEYFAARNIAYYRTIGSDDALAGALVGELKRRGVDLYRTQGKVIETQDRRDHIALISEWDTVYG
jgi:hypothetical protein